MTNDTLLRPPLVFRATSAFPHPQIAPFPQLDASADARGTLTDGSPTRVLVQGTVQDFRALAAAAFLERLGGAAVEVRGPACDGVRPSSHARAVMSEVGVDLAAPRACAPRLDSWDYVVTFGDGTPHSTSHSGSVLRWHCHDPALYAGTADHRIVDYRRARDVIRGLVADLLVRLEARAD